MKRGSGWHNESHRHRLASMGYNTKPIIFESAGQKGKNSTIECSFTRDFEKHKQTIQDWTWDDRMEMDESCMMADDTLQLLDRVVNPEEDTLKYYIDEHEARLEKLKDVRLIECDGELVGFVKYYDYYPEDNLKVVYLDELFLHSDHRKKGLGVKTVVQVFEESGANRMKGNSLHQSVGFWKGLGAWISPYEVQGKRVFAIDYAR